MRACPSFRVYTLDCTMQPPPPLVGDVKIIFYDHDQFGTDDKMFHMHFNTGYVEKEYLRFSRMVLDKACKDKSGAFTDEFECELFFEEKEATRERLGSKYEDIGGFDNDVDKDEDHDD